MLCPGAPSKIATVDNRTAFLGGSQLIETGVQFGAAGEAAGLGLSINDFLPAILQAFENTVGKHVRINAVLLPAVDHVNILGRGWSVKRRVG